MVIPINEQYSLSNLKVTLGVDTLNLKASIKEKEGTTIEVTSRPSFDPVAQRIVISDLKLNTDTDNFLLKSVGWIAQTFLTGKIDKKLEEQANTMYMKQLEKLKEKPIEVKIPQGGTAKIMLNNITIHELVFLEHAIGVTATIHSHFKVHLTV